MLDKSIANAGEVESSRSQAGEGLSFDSALPRIVSARSILFRIGHRTVKNQHVPEADNYMSPWWISEADFKKILHLGQSDTSWAARVSLAIAEEWGGDCALQIRVETREPLYAWSGTGRVIGRGRKAVAVSASSPMAYWFPDASIKQLFIPGLKGMKFGQTGALWATAFGDRSASPWLAAGSANRHLDTGKPFGAPLPAGRRRGSV